MRDIIILASVNVYFLHVSEVIKSNASGRVMLVLNYWSKLFANLPSDKNYNFFST